MHGSRTHRVEIEFGMTALIAAKRYSGVNHCVIDDREFEEDFGANGCDLNEWESYQKWKEEDRRRNGTQFAKIAEMKREAKLSWSWMKFRCYNPRSNGFKYYGGRGIRICQRWLSFSAFYWDMGERPEGHSIDRINTNGHYSCGKCKECRENGWTANCRWATPSQQRVNQNKRGYLTELKQPIAA